MVQDNYIDGKGGSATDKTGDISTTIAVDGLEDKSRHHFFVGGRKMRSCFNGAIDRVRVYARALTADEIAHHWESPDRAASEKALVLRLDFDDVQGTTCKDKSGCGNDGKMHHVGVQPLSCRQNPEMQNTHKKQSIIPLQACSGEQLVQDVEGARPNIRVHHERLVDN